MALFEWNENLELGIPKIDAQHKQLFDWINFLDEAVARGEGGIIVRDLLSELSRYVIEHFSFEEDYMLSHNFPDYEPHCLEHYFFTKWLIEAMTKKTDEHELSRVTVKFMVDWIVGHIEGTDQFYREFIFNKEHPAESL